MTSSLSRTTRGVAAFLASVGLVGGSVLMSAPAFAATAQDIGVETSKNTAIDSYKTLVANDSFAGPSVSSNCSLTPSVPTSAQKTAMLNSVNAVRTLAHVDPVKLGDSSDTGWSAAAQAARTFALKGTINHSIDSTWPCFTAAGQSAANYASLAIGYNKPGNFVRLWATDKGQISAGHRINMIDPVLEKLVFGLATAGTNYSGVLGTAFNDSHWNSFEGITGPTRNFTDTTTTTGTNPAILAWPSAGYFPAELATDSGMYWTFSIHDIANWNANGTMGDAVVEVKVPGSSTFQKVTSTYSYNGGKSGTPYPTAQNFNGGSRYSTLAFKPPVTPTVPSGDAEQVYTVRVTSGDRVWTYPVKFISGATATKTTSTETGTNTGTSTGTNTGTSTGTNTGTSTGTNTGTSTGTNTGTSTGTNTGTSTGTNTGTSTGTNTGTSTGTNTGTSTGTNTGTSTGTTTQPSTGTNTQQPGTSTQQPGDSSNNGGGSGFGFVLLLLIPLLLALFFGPLRGILPF